MRGDRSRARSRAGWRPSARSRRRPASAPQRSARARVRPALSGRRPQVPRRAPAWHYRIQPSRRDGLRTHRAVGKMAVNSLMCVLALCRSARILPVHQGEPPFGVGGQEASGRRCDGSPVRIRILLPTYAPHARRQSPQRRAALALSPATSTHVARSASCAFAREATALGRSAAPSETRAFAGGSPTQQIQITRDPKPAPERHARTRLGSRPGDVPPVGSERGAASRRSAGPRVRGSARRCVSLLTTDSGRGAATCLPRRSANARRRVRAAAGYVGGSDPPPVSPCTIVAALSKSTSAQAVRCTG